MVVSAATLVQHCPNTYARARRRNAELPPIDDRDLELFQFVSKKPTRSLELCQVASKATTFRAGGTQTCAKASQTERKGASPGIMPCPMPHHLFLSLYVTHMNQLQRINLNC